MKIVFREIHYSERFYSADPLSHWWEQLHLYLHMQIYFEINISDKKSRHFDLSEVEMRTFIHLKMTSKRSKRRDFLSLIFISKSISKKLLIKICKSSCENACTALILLFYTHLTIVQKYEESNHSIVFNFFTIIQYPLNNLFIFLV